MPMARTKRGRLRQIERWLNDEFPTPRPTYVVMHDFGRNLQLSPEKQDFGDCDRVGRRIRIRIHSRLSWHFAIWTLFHEWAHSMTWPLASMEYNVEEHPDEMGLAFIRIWRKFYDEEGWRESRDYDSD
jgi:hypothetical protein